jgi:hypothetical protein
MALAMIYPTPDKRGRGNKSKAMPDELRKLATKTGYPLDAVAMERGIQL